MGNGETEKNGSKYLGWRELGANDLRGHAVQRAHVDRVGPFLPLADFFSARWSRGIKVMQSSYKLTWYQHPSLNDCLWQSRLMLLPRQDKIAS